VVLALPHEARTVHVRSIIEQPPQAVHPDWHDG
jgi:hypothetical protein